MSTTTKKAAAAVATKTLANGKEYYGGKISSTLRWQASGILVSGCDATGVSGLDISSGCYHMRLAATGELQDDSPISVKREYDPEEEAALYDDHLEAYFTAFPEQLPETFAAQVNGSALHKRQIATCPPDGNGENNSGTDYSSDRQRIELLSWPGAAAGETWSYSWKSYQSSTSTSPYFFHSWQLLRRDFCGGPVVWMDWMDGLAQIGDAVRGCEGDGACPSASLSKFFGKTVKHSITVKYGLSGTFSYSVANVDTPNTPIMTYAAVGDMGSSVSLKFGQYRNVTEGIRIATAYVGEYKATQLS